MATTHPISKVEEVTLPMTAYNLDQYFNRINYTGDRRADLNTLRAIHLLHPRYIPFENLNPFLQIPVRLDIDSLVTKIIHQKRGGYCFEHNLLLKAVLETLGFKVKGLAARVLWGQPPGAITARGHMLMLVETDGTHYIADVGFGGQTLTAPLVLKAGLEQQTPHEPFRLVDIGGAYRLESLIRGEWKALYRFDLTENFQVDYELTSWYLSNFPASHFVTGLIAARTEEDKRYAVRNRELSIHYLNGDTEKHTVTSARELETVLKEIFGLQIPDTNKLRHAFETIQA